MDRGEFLFPVLFPWRISLHPPLTSSPAVTILQEQHVLLPEFAVQR